MESRQHRRLLALPGRPGPSGEEAPQPVLAGVPAGHAAGRSGWADPGGPGRRRVGVQVDRLRQPIDPCDTALVVDGGKDGDPTHITCKHKSLASVRQDCMHY